MIHLGKSFSSPFVYKLQGELSEKYDSTMVELRSNLKADS